MTKGMKKKRSNKKVYISEKKRCLNVLFNFDYSLEM